MIPVYPVSFRQTTSLTLTADSGNESERQKIRESLLDYCKLDTLAKVMIWQQLIDIEK
jgi:hypothetical protein